MRKNIWWIVGIAVVMAAAIFQAASGGGQTTTYEISATFAPAPTSAPTPEPAETPAPTDTPAPSDTTPQEESPPAPEAGEAMVWIPVNGGKKYHSTASCSNMIDPECVAVSEAAARGFEPCGRCM